MVVYPARSKDSPAGLEGTGQTNTSFYFPARDECSTHTIFPGVTIHTAACEKMMLSYVELAAHSVVEEHSHPHEQVTYVLSGRFEFTVGDQTTILEPGMIALIPGGVTHGGKTITACRIIDVFSPVREDYR